MNSQGNIVAIIAAILSICAILGAYIIMTTTIPTANPLKPPSTSIPTPAQTVTTTPIIVESSAESNIQSTNLFISGAVVFVVVVVLFAIVWWWWHRDA